MKTLKIYKNYGCLAAEKRVIYTFGAQHHTASCSEIMIVEVPKGWNLSEGKIPDSVILESPWGWTYDPNEVLSGNDDPCFSGMDKSGKRFRIALKVVEE